MFELADSWRAFGVPEQALSLYQQLMALPKGQGLPPRDVPRLYTQMGATLQGLDKYAESLAIIDEGLRLYPAYRPLRAWRLFALCETGRHQQAVVECLALMVESLAPSKWDVFEEDILRAVKTLGERIDEGRQPDEDAPDAADGDEGGAALEVKVRPAKPKSRKRGRRGQFGRKPIQIDIMDQEEGDDRAASGKISIPIDVDPD